ncbi:MAG: YHYH domain-containing protein [Acidobacteria bacterium]|nr:YHYH domain-containing protein [Acidobacteriota bacterium]
MFPARLVLGVACAVTVVALFVFNAPVVAHGGGLDAYGGHRDTKAGDYHVHQGTCAGRTFASKESAVQAGCRR